MPIPTIHPEMSAGGQSDFVEMERSRMQCMLLAPLNSGRSKYHFKARTGPKAVSCGSELVMFAGRLDEKRGRNSTKGLIFSSETSASAKSSLSLLNSQPIARTEQENSFIGQSPKTFRDHRFTQGYLKYPWNQGKASLRN